MKEVSLIPSSTGLPGGKQTGQRMTHYIAKGGLFANAFYKMPEAFILPFTTMANVSDRLGLLGGVFKPSGVDKTLINNKKKYKTKYHCSICKVNVWGKPELKIICGICDVPFAEKLPD